MKPQTEINNQWRILHKIYNNENETFDWEDMKSEIKTLIEMKLNMELHVPLLNVFPELEE